MMRTLFVTPSSFEKFEGGVSTRYQAIGKITSFWYPVCLADPTGLVKECHLIDGPAQGVSSQDTINIAQDYDFIERDLDYTKHNRPSLPPPYISFYSSVFPPDRHPPLTGKYTFIGGRCKRWPVC